MIREKRCYGTGETEMGAYDEVTMATVVGIKVSTVVGSRLDDINECVWELDIGTTS